jgi:serine/threonine protein kinase
MVLKYADNGSLRNYLNTNYNKLNWNSKISHLLEIARGLEYIHKNEFIHRDLHSGNILTSMFKMWIADMGLCKPADYNPLKSNIYGVLPYVAPEILRGQNYTKASDIYSFGMIMYEIISELPPYHDISHDENLAIKICKGLRPRFNIKVPQLIIYLIKRCLDANQLNRPMAKEISDILHKWRYQKRDSQTAELQRQIKEAEIINNNSSNNNMPLTNLGLSYETHSRAIYTSRLLNFNNLPEPINSDDYYKQSDNIISLEFSGID